ncbi:MAG: hypothetical protein NZT92_19290 [Abditibacteriales bacterium]|nr:hypothetical protein [Abditibacteriales bacterium]MDW8366074.1 hypothetical protein [Abditibacteriales bacterium]
MKRSVVRWIIVVLVLGCWRGTAKAELAASPFSLFPPSSSPPLLSPPLGYSRLEQRDDFLVVTDYRPAEYRGKTLTPGYAHREARVTLRPTDRSYLSTALIDALVLPRFTRADGDALRCAPDRRPLFSDQFRYAERGLHGRQFAGGAGNLSGSFSTLEIGKIRHAGLFQSTANRLNDTTTSRATTFALRDLSQLSGVTLKDYNLRYAPSPQHSFTVQNNDVHTPGGGLHIRDMQLLAGTCSLLKRERAVDRAVANGVLQGLGRPDLIPLKGVQLEEWQGRWKPSEQFFLSLLRKDADTPGGSVSDARTELKAGIVSVTQRERSIAPHVTDPVLQGLGRKDLLPLRGVKDSGASLRIEPSQDLQLSLEKNSLQTSSGGVEERLAQIVAGGFTLARRYTAVGQNVANTVLEGVGRQDLATSKGMASDEIAAEWRTKKLTLWGLRRTEEVSLNSGLFFGEGVIVNHVRRQGVAVNLSARSTVEASHETVTSAPKDEDGAPASVQHTQTVQLSQKLSKATSTTLSHQQSTLTEGDRVIRADELATQWRTGYGKMARFHADWRQRHSSDGRHSGGVRLAMGLMPRAWSLNALWQSDYGFDRRSSQYGFSISKKLSEQQQFSLTSQTRRSLTTDAVTTAQSQTLTLNLWRGSLLEYTRTSQINNSVAQASSLHRLGSRLEREQVMFHQPFGRATRLVLRGMAVANNQEKDYSHGFFVETQQRLMSLQVGQEELMGADGKFQPVHFLRLSAQPHKAFAFDWGLADRRDLAKDPVVLTDWKLESALGGVKLTAHAVRNKPVGNPKASILPMLLSDVNPVSERAFSVSLPLFGRFNFSSTYTAQENLRAGTAVNGYTFALSDKPGGMIDVAAKYTLGKQFPRAGWHDYALYELDARYRLSSGSFIAFTGRTLAHEDPAKKHYTFDLSLGWRW